LLSAIGIPSHRLAMPSLDGSCTLPSNLFLVILRLDLKIRLRMRANRAYLGRLLADNNVAAVRALPDAVAVAREDDLVLHIGEQLEVTRLVLLLDLANLLKQERDIVKTFLTRFLCKSRVHIGPLVVLALSRRLQVGCGVVNAAVEQLEPDFCVLL